MSFTVALSGDCILTKRLSVLTAEDFLDLVHLFQSADLSFTHFETLIHCFEGEEVYPASTAGWTWMQAPSFVPDELKWAGFNLVSLASNHALDYSYGGLKSTWRAIEEAGLPHAGTGSDLARARAATYLDTAQARVALVSMCSSFDRWAAAGEARCDMKGRPGLNPLRYHYWGGEETIKIVVDLALQMGLWVAKCGREWHINPPGVHNSVTRFITEPGAGKMRRVLDQDDRLGNLASITEAAAKADFVIVHLHSHEWDIEKDLHVAAEFVPLFARECIDAGADLFIAEGSHAMMRGIEIYRGKAIFYDPGDLINSHETIERLPADFFYRPGYDKSIRTDRTTSAQAFAARKRMEPAINPPGGYYSAPVPGFVIPVCRYNHKLELEEICLYPAKSKDGSLLYKGIPGLVSGEEGAKIISYLNELSHPYGTKIKHVDGRGVITLEVS